MKSMRSLSFTKLSFLVTEKQINQVKTILEEILSDIVFVFCFVLCVYLCEYTFSCDCLCSIGDRTQGFMYIRKAFYHSNCTSSPQNSTII